MGGKITPSEKCDQASIFNSKLFVICKEIGFFLPFFIFDREKSVHVVYRGNRI